MDSSWVSAPSRHHRSWSLRSARACYAWPAVRPMGRSSTGSQPSMRQPSYRWCAMRLGRGPRDRGELLLPERERRHRARRREVRHRRPPLQFRYARHRYNGSDAATNSRAERGGRRQRVTARPALERFPIRRSSTTSRCTARAQRRAQIQQLLRRQRNASPVHSHPPARSGTRLLAGRHRPVAQRRLRPATLSSRRVGDASGAARIERSRGRRSAASHCSRSRTQRCMRREHRFPGRPSRSSGR